ncbi:MAG: menaquinone biosynthesis protein [Acidobacteriota bacterium]
MQGPRITASSYSNSAPLLWSFLYGSNRGKAEIILDNAPSRSVELFSLGRVDAALVPVFAFQTIEGARLVPDVCIGAKDRVRSVCLITDGRELEDVKSVSLDVSSKTSAALTKIIFREFLNFEPTWSTAEPNISRMLEKSDAALLIGDPALIAGKHAEPTIRKFDLAELWNRYTGLGFVFAMWMAKSAKIPLDFAAARDEGCDHLEEIISNYEPELALGREEMRAYLSENISYSINDKMREGMKLYFELAERHGLIPQNKPLIFAGQLAENA